MNDPNGLVYYDGEYHMFYQYYPDSTVWGPMHWGHTVSNDMVHWKNLPVALFPDSLGYIFSGSAVVDMKNSSGLQAGQNPPIVAIFTQHSEVKLKEGRNDFQVQSAAFSNDKGLTFTKYSHNPVIANPGERDFRDPKVRWDKRLQKWILVLAAGQKVMFYNSSDLTDWEFLSEFGTGAGSHGGVWECPDLFPLMINGNEKWVLLVSINPGAPNGGSGTQYFIGNFDGQKFTNDNTDSTSLWLDYGPDNYAGVSWSDIPESDGRRIYIGWMSNWNYAQVVPTVAWRSAMTLPRKLELKNSDAGIRLFSTPVRELDQIRTAEQTPDISDGSVIKISGLNEFILKIDLNNSTSDNFGLTFSDSKGDRLVAGFDRGQNRFYIDRTNSGITSFSKAFTGINFAPRQVNDSIVEMRLFLDRSSLELFADGGSVCMTSIFFPTENLTMASLFQDNGKIKITGFTKYDLTSVWK